ncbi:MAG: DUF2809 domain-containing protein [Crocinitomix sp.]|nr:DUF2809 domain-containing protein [Crocinitomix sp.]
MRWNWKYALIAIVILLIEIMIALFVRDQFIRPFIGDLLVVVLLYFSFRTILKAKASSVAIGVFIFAVGIEVLQFFQLAELLELENNGVARVILGSTFDWLDILAYALGIVLAYFADQKYLIKTK